MTASHEHRVRGLLRRWRSAATAPSARWLCVGALGALVLPGSAAAQFRPNLRQRWPVQQIMLDKVQLSGRVAELDPAKLRVTDDKNLSWMVGIDPARSQVVVLGEAEPDVLEPGMYVRFEAEVDARGTVKRPVEQLTIFTPDANTETGVLEDDGDLGRGPTRDRGGPPDEVDAADAAEVPSEAPPAAEERPATRQRNTGQRGSGRRGRGKDDDLPVARALVSGTVKSFRGNKLLVDTPDKVVRATLAKDVEIVLEVNDFTLAQPGDEVKAAVWRARPGQGMAETLEIRLSEPVLSEKKRKVVEQDDPAAGDRAGVELDDEGGRERPPRRRGQAPPPNEPAGDDEEGAANEPGQVPFPE